MLCTTVALLLFLVAAAAATPVAAREIKGRSGTEGERVLADYQTLGSKARSPFSSATSFFDFRTFDPEGVIFYGDTIPGVDWFVLALREGKPEIHIHNFITNITISSGRPVNDGRWHKIMVKNQGHQVILAVDGEDHLTLSHVSDSIVDQPHDTMRIVVGGLLIPVEELLVPLNPAMDGCMRRYKWLNQTSERLEGISAQDKGAKACFHTISNGSFFPGDGQASFTLTGLPASRPNNWNWSLTVEMWIQAAQQSSTLLAISGAKEAPVLCLNLQLMALVAQVGNKTALSVPLPVGPCRDLHVHLSVTPSHLKLHLGDAEASMDLSKKDFEILTHPWLKGKGHLSIGGLPGPDPSVAAQERSYFRGCLREVRVQGVKLDFDSVNYRSDSIWAHSCPGERGSKANTYGEN